MGYTGLVWADSIDWTIGMLVTIDQNYRLLDSTRTITITFLCLIRKVYKNIVPV